MVQIDFHDQGPEIPAEVREQIFERFYQPSHQVLPRYKGLGVGLSISREIARAHGGDITVHSTPDSGSIFRMTLPSGFKKSDRS
jgi:two-component system OmpR family sensor kinase